MAQMSVTSAAMHFGALHEKAAIFGFADHLVVHRLIKRRPACAAVKLVRLIKQDRAAAFAGENARFFREIIMRKSAFGPMLAQNFESKIIQLGTPFGIGFDNFIHAQSPLSSRRHSFCDRIHITI